MWIRLLLFLFTVFGLLVALPLVVWDVTHRFLYTPLALVLTILSVFVPIAVIAYCNIEPDPDDADVPIRIAEDAAVNASIITGILVGAAAVLWLIF